MPRANLFLVAVFLCLILAGAARASSKNQEFSDFTTPLPLKPGDVLVLGVVGGWERWDAPRIVRNTAIAVRQKNYPGVYAETVENHKMELGWQLLEKALDWNRSGVLDEDEKHGARLIVYGQSLGGSASVRMARELGQRGIPVLLLISIDSYGKGDELVPPNVRAALNIYQRDHLLIKGENDFRAADPEKTKILGNLRLRLRGKGADALGDPRYREEGWLRRTFLGSHLKIEYDRRVQDLILETVLQHIPEDRKRQAGILSEQ